MARPRQVDMGLVAQAQILALEAETLEDLRCAQAVLVPALLDATLEETAAVMGLGVPRCPDTKRVCASGWGSPRSRRQNGAVGAGPR